MPVLSYQKKRLRVQLLHNRGAGTVSAVARKKKRKTFRAVKAVKEAAREKLGAPPATRRVPDKKKLRREKHKPTLGRLLGEI